MHKASYWVDECDSETLISSYRAMLYNSGFSVLGEQVYHFQPHGMTALWLLGESHLAIHTFPEHSAAYVELTSCIDKPFEEFLAIETRPKTRITITTSRA